MRGDQHADTVIGPLADGVPEQGPGQRVHSRCRFVQQHDLGPVGQRRDERDLALGPQRQVADEHIPVLGQVVVQRGRRDSVGAGHERQVLGDGQIGVQAQILRHVTRVAGGAPAPIRRTAQHPDAPLRGRDQPKQHPDQRRLAGPVGAEQPDHLSATDVHRHLVHGGERTEPAGHGIGPQHRVRHDPGPFAPAVAAACRRSRDRAITMSSRSGVTAAEWPSPPAGKPSGQYSRRAVPRRHDHSGRTGSPAAVTVPANPAHDL